MIEEEYLEDGMKIPGWVRIHDVLFDKKPDERTAVSLDCPCLLPTIFFHNNSKRGEANLGCVGFEPETHDRNIQSYWEPHS